MKSHPALLQHKLAALSAILVVAGATIATQSGSALSTTASIVPAEDAMDSLDGQLGEFVREALAKNAAAKSFREWESSGFTPGEILGNVKARHTSEAYTALCGVLARLDAESLALFEDELDRPENQKAMSCAPALSKEVKAYWKTSAEALSLGIAPVKPGHAHAEAADSRRTYEEKTAVSALSGEAEPFPPPGNLAILIDDGPHPTRTRRILKALKSEGVHANYFVMGRNAREYPELVQREVAEGHAVGSSTWTRPDLASLDMKSAQDEILKARETVAMVTGEPVSFFSFPYASSTPALRDFVRGIGLSSFESNIDSADWRLRSPAELLRHVMAEIDRKKGGSILFHDISEPTAIIFPRFLAALKQRGIKTVVYDPGVRLLFGVHSAKN